MGHIGIKGLCHTILDLQYDDSDPESCKICAQANIK
jgi:hypothetical protein